MQRCCCGTVCGGGGEQRAGRRCWRQIARAAACLRCWDGMECEREPVRVEGRVLLQSGECSVCGVCWPRGEVVWVVGEEVRSDTGAPSVVLPNQAEQLWKQPRRLFRRPASRQIARNFHRPPPHRSFVGHLSASAQPSSPLRRCECCGSARPKATTLHIILLHEPGYSKLRLLYAYFTLYVCSVLTHSLTSPPVPHSFLVLPSSYLQRAHPAPIPAPAATFPRIHRAHTLPMAPRPIRPLCALYATSWRGCPRGVTLRRTAGPPACLTPCHVGPASISSQSSCAVANNLRCATHYI
jgi:hypothetical protein